MDLDPNLQRLAELIWRTSRNDEGTISAMGADVIALAIADSDWLHSDRARAWHEGYQRGRDGLSQMNPYRD